MTTIAELAVRLIGDTKDFVSKMDDAKSRVGNFSKAAISGLSSIGGSLALGGLAVAGAGVYGLTKLLEGSVQSAMEAESAMAEVRAVLASTGGVAGETEEQVVAFASSMQKVTKFSDETIMAGQSMLLTFTNIGKEVFPQAATAVLDLAEKFGGVDQAAIQLGKALNDPIEGVGALKRVGVSFTEAQEDLIKSLVKGGDIAGAQKVILDELSKEFGGLAVAAGSTTEGKLAQFNNAMDDLKELIGNQVIPAFLPLVQLLTEKLTNPETIAFVENFAEGIASLVKYLVDVVQYGDPMNDWLTHLPASIRPVVKAIGEFVVYMMENIPKAFAWLMENKGVIVGAVTAIGLALAVAAWTAMAPLLPAIAVILLVAGAAYLLYTAWTQNWGGIQQKVAEVWAVIQPVLQNIWSWLQINIPIAIQAMQKAWVDLQPQIAAAITFINGVIQALVPVVQWVTTYISTIVKAWQAAFNGDWYQFGVLLRQAWDMVWKLIATIVSNAWTNIKASLSTLVRNAVNFVKTYNWADAGKNIVMGLAKGILGNVSFAVNAIKSMSTAIMSAIKGFFGIASPSKLMEREVAQWLVKGAFNWKPYMNRSLFEPAFAQVPVLAGNQMRGLGGGGGGSLSGGLTLVNYGTIIMPNENTNQSESLLRQLS